MLSPVSSLKELMKPNPSLGNLNLSLNGLLIKIKKSPADNSADSIGKTVNLNINASSRLSIGSDSIPINILEILSDWSSLPSLIDATSP